MRLSRPRIALRATLLCIGGAFMLHRASRAWAAARSLGGGEALLQSRLAVVWSLVGVLALVTAAAALLALRRGRRGRARLGLPHPERDAGPPATRPPPAGDQ